MKNTLSLALIAVFCYGISSPLIKPAYDRGLPNNAYLVTYAISLLVIAWGTSKPGDLGLVALSPSGMGFAIAAGIFAATGFKAAAVAFSLPGANISVIVLLLGAFPLITVAISFLAFNEYQSLKLGKFLAGALMIIAGGYLVNTSAITK